MASVEEHIKRIKEHTAEIKDAIDAGLENKPATIGFHCSACSTSILELYLHITNKISVGKVVKHDWFKKPKIGQKIEPLIERKLSINFEDKEKIYCLIYEIEEKRDKLCYGKSSKEDVGSVLDSFLRLKEILSEKLSKEGIRIE